jgi:2-methylisocitrate lyase-like PEP mutase family enzyme
MKKTTMLRKILSEKKLLVSAGAHDALSARVIAMAGFEVVFLSGFGFEASLLGKPDVGLLSMSEVVNHAKNIAMSVDVPVLADAEAGYGGFSNIQRTVREFERAGVAGIFIEDQAHPVMCGSLKKFKKIIPMDEMVTKLKCALASREDPDFMICARTDADIVSIDEQIIRCNAYAKAGADMVTALPYTIEEFRALVKGVKGPLWVYLSSELPITPKDLEEAGVRGLVVYATECAFVATKAMMDLMTELRNKGTVTETMTKYQAGGFFEFFNFIGLPDTQEWEQRWLEGKI